jgi:20S proteasome alpha/beta subunit
VTVALGLVCADGVIVAADSMASDGTTAHPATKVNVVPNCSVVWTSSGTVYIAEEVEAAIAKEAARPNSPILASCRSGNAEHVREVLSKTVCDAMRKCYQSALPLGANQMFNVPGQQNPKHQFATSFLFLGWSDPGCWFLEIADDGQLNWHTDTAFYAIGSGGPFATVAQGLMHHYWESPRPVSDGRLVAYRAIASTIDVSSQFVGYPVRLAEATSQGARVLDDEEVEAEIKTSVERWMVLERESLERLRVGDLEDLTATEEEIPSLNSKSGMDF